MTEITEIPDLLRRCADYLDWVETDINDGELSVAAANAKGLMQTAEDLMEHIKIRMQVVDA